MSVKLFKTDWLERLTYMPLGVFLPFWIVVVSIVLWACRSLVFFDFLLAFAGGFLLWTATEYIGHRFFFHLKPSSAIGKRLVFLMHGNHHELPSDKLRNMMPLIVTIPVGYAIFCALHASLGDYGIAVFSGFVTGYVGYDLIHYLCHQHQFRSGIMGHLRRHHLIHHFASPDKNFSVSNTLWDYVFNTKSGSKRSR